MKSAPAGSAVKVKLRNEARGRRDALSPEARAAASTAVAERAIAIIAKARPAVLGVYRAIDSEVDPEAIVTWATEQGIACVLPAVANATTLVFRHYDPGAPLASGGFGTLAPTAEAAEMDPDFLVVPLLAFDRHGTRLGYGRGFYDRAVERLAERGHKPPRLGLAFSVQEVPAIPSESHDARLDWVATEKALFDFSVHPEG